MLGNLIVLGAALIQMTQADYLGSYRATAYSGHNGSTYGASGRTLIPNYSVATCDCIPMGTLLYIEDFGIVRVDDRIGEGSYVEENNHHVLDLYLEDFATSCEWGAQWKDIIVIGEYKDD